MTCLNRFTVTVFLFVSLFLTNILAAKTLDQKLNRQGVRIVYLDEMRVASIYVHTDGTVLTFPVKPEVHVGKKESFDIIYVKNDLVISALAPGARTNLFIYLLGRRYTLKLIYTGTGGDEIVAIRDPNENKLEVEVK